MRVDPANFTTSKALPFEQVKLFVVSGDNKAWEPLKVLQCLIPSRQESVGEISQSPPGSSAPGRH
jgi:hypothetical protein